MHKPTIFMIITAAILLTATVATALYSLKEANAQANKTIAANKTSAGGKQERVTSTNPLNNITIGSQEKITNKTAGGGNMTNATG